MKRLIIILTLTPILILAACAPADEGTLGEDADSLEAAQEMQDFRMDVEEALAEADRTIDSLQVQVQEGELQAEVDSVVADLQSRMDSLQQDLQELEAATVENWEGVKDEIEENLSELEEDIREARGRYETPTLPPTL